MSPLPHPAKRAAPRAVASLHAGTRNVRPQASALICCHTALRAPPPSEYTEMCIRDRMKSFRSLEADITVAAVADPRHAEIAPGLAGDPYFALSLIHI